MIQGGWPLYTEKADALSEMLGGKSSEREVLHSVRNRFPAPMPKVPVRESA
jgi:hypothetical protein